MLNYLTKPTHLQGFISKTLLNVLKASDRSLFFR